MLLVSHCMGRVQGAQVLDEHEVVLRFNNPPVRQYKGAVGSKATFQLLSHDFVTKFVSSRGGKAERNKASKDRDKDQVRAGKPAPPGSSLSVAGVSVRGAPSPPLSSSQRTHSVRRMSSLEILTVGSRSAGRSLPHGAIQGRVGFSHPLDSGPQSFDV